MRSLIKLTIASLAAVALFAGMASAQTTPKFSGNVGAAFGQYTFGETNQYEGNDSASRPRGDGKGTSEYATSFESNFRMTLDTDKLQAIVRYRVRGSQLASAGTHAATPATSNLGPGPTSAFTSSANDVYHEIWWKPSDAFKIGFGKFQGQDWSNPLTGSYVISNPIGDGEYWMNWTGVPGIDFEYNVGVVQVGLAIASVCKPSCNTAAGVGGYIATGTAGSTTSGTITELAKQSAGQSIVPHLTGKFGDISIRAQFPQTSGTYQCRTTSPTDADNNLGPDCGTDSVAASTKSDKVVTVSGAGYQVGVAWAGMPGVRVALDMSSFTEGKSKFEPADRVRKGTALKVDAASVTFMYFTLTDNFYGKEKAEFFTSAHTNNTNTPFTSGIGQSSGKDGQNTQMTLRYTLPMGSGAIIPEYRSSAYNDAWCAAADVKTRECKALTNTEIRLIGNVNY